jgi:hypothetical protein
MISWQEEIKKLEEEIKELEIKLYHPHLIKSTEEDYDIKSKIIKKQTRIIAIYVQETEKLVKQATRTN